MPIITSQLIKYTLYGATIGDNTAPGVAAYFRSGVGNDNSPCSYAFRAEDIVVGRVPTVRRIVLDIATIGACPLTFTLSGVNDAGTTVTSTVTQTIGTGSFGPFPLGSFNTVFVDIEITAFRPQLTITRAASGGAFSIASVMLVGTVEDQTL